MSSKEYAFDIGKEGAVGLGILDNIYNPTTKEFLSKAGLKPGMKVLDVGCGSGVMTSWIAQEVSEKGLVVGVENDINQLNAAKKRASDTGVKNTEFVLCSIYDLDQLDQEFDLVYCRFVLHHMQDPNRAIEKIFRVLKKEGIYAAEEGVVNYAFSYPKSSAWGDEESRLPPVWTDYPVGNRDPNIGIKMATKMRQAGFTVHDVKIIHPILSTKEEKKLLMLGIDEGKNYFLSQGKTEADWNDRILETQALIDNDEQIVGFNGSCQVFGIK